MRRAAEPRHASTTRRTARAARPPRAIPHFASREEEAAFWDSHDFADFVDEAEAVDAYYDAGSAAIRPRPRRAAKQAAGDEPPDASAPSAPTLSSILAVRLEGSVLEELRQAAAPLGIGPSTLARMWLLERLRSERRKGDVQR